MRLTKAVATDLPYTFQYYGWSIFDATPIISATVASTPSGLTLGSPAVSADGKAVSVRISGGTAGVTYTVTVTPQTSEGYKDPYSVTMEVV